MKDRALRIIYAMLAGFLLVSAFALSFGALRHRAVEAEIIHGALATVLWGGLSVHTQAGIWALCPDVLAVVGIVGLRLNRRDPRAWAALILGLGLTLTFQVWNDPWSPLLRAVPAIAGAMAVWMMEVPWNRSELVPVPEVRPGVTQDAPRRERPVTPGRPRNGTPLPKADAQALDRARKDPVEVERVMLRRGIDRSTVAARPERWPLPSRNGVTPTQVRSPGGRS